MTTTTLFIWDGLNLLLEENAGLIARVQWTNFPDEAREVLVMREVGTTGLSNGASFFPGFDLSGNTRLVAGKAGILKWRTLYESFGEERALIGYGGEIAQSTLGAGYGGQTLGLSILQGYGGQVGSTFDAALNHLRFGGQVGYYTDREGRVYVRARHYDSSTGRWLSRDPIEFDEDGWNLYGYVLNDPVGLVDPEGEAPRRRGQLPSWYRGEIDPTDESFWDMASWHLRTTGKVFRGYGTAAAGMASGTLDALTGRQAYEMYQFFRKHGVNRNSVFVYGAGGLVQFSDRALQALEGDPDAFGEVWLPALATAAGGAGAARGLANWKAGGGRVTVRRMSPELQRQMRMNRRGALGPFTRRAVFPGKAYKLRMRGRSQPVGRGHTPGHVFAMNRVAVQMAKSGKYRMVYRHSTYKAISRLSNASGRLPDVAGVRHSGRILAVEIPSGRPRVPTTGWPLVRSATGDYAGSGLANLLSRNRRAMQTLPPAMRGRVIIIHKKGVR